MTDWVRAARRAAPIVLLLASLRVGDSIRAASPIEYSVSFPEPEHHWVQVEARFSEVGPTPVELRMSRSAPGRYSMHDFAKNVYDVHVRTPEGRELTITRTDPYGWTVPEHGDSVSVSYKVFGDLIDGTYLAVDRAHAHINMPAIIMWARGLDDRPSLITFVVPPERQWRIATQLHEAGPDTFSAPNLQYLMDSPTELGPSATRHFTVDGHEFRFAAHHTGTDAELDRFVVNVEKIVRQEEQVFGEFPAYEPGAYTFIADYLPYAEEDGMEHRNSSILTSRTSIGGNSSGLLDSVAHEFFHSWNVERIRPQSIEPFDLERVNMSDELWLAEGFTQYYGPLMLSRTGIANLQTTAWTFRSYAASAMQNPARAIRSAVEMSRMGAFTDRSMLEDRTNWPNTVLSYYELGAAIAMSLDLSLRERTGGHATLDDFMRAMWRTHGKPGGSREGYVDHPYTERDAQARLAEVSGDAAFAADFFRRYVDGKETPDFASLFRRAGLVLRKQFPGRASWGDVKIDFRSGGARVMVVPPSTSPAYAAGIDVDDQVRSLDGRTVSSGADISAVLRQRRPGDRIPIVFTDRTGMMIDSTITLVEDDTLELVPVESTGGALTSEERTFRESWLGVR